MVRGFGPVAVLPTADGKITLVGGCPDGPPLVGAPFVEGSIPGQPARFDDRLTFVSGVPELDWPTKGYVQIVRI